MTAQREDRLRWMRLQGSRPPGGPALFLDRDGVLIADKGYLDAPSSVEILDGASELVAAANRAGVTTVVVTNQSGVARGYFDWEAVTAIHDEVDRRLSAFGARIDAVYACGDSDDRHPWRKPNPGMVLAARDDLDLDLGASWIVGDRARDLMCGERAGVPGGTLVGPEEQREALSLASASFSVASADSVTSAVATIPLLGGQHAHR